ncbi:MAG TPA: N-methyl-L-tryptophan oxidase [Actinomycetota bacterium]|nr:N-methyl-L-tryptophan oxidase [Actinomycetota bacterium]
MAERFDAVVVGLGGMGSAACFHLARRGWRVLGLEQFDLVHPFGSSHGLTRIIRLAYSEHPAYVPLLHRAYELWHELENLHGERLLWTTGSLEGGTPEGQTFQGALEAARRHGLPHEVLSGEEVGRRWPAFRLPPEARMVYQPDGGFLASEECIVAHVRQALAAGAELHWRERVQEWGGLEDGVWVRTDRGRYEARRLVVSAGAWVGKLLPDLSGLAVPERQVLGWFLPRRPERFRLGALPVWVVQDEEARWYGFPEWKVPGLKLGRFHHLEERVDPDALDREPTPHDEEVLRAFVERVFPDAAGPTVMLRVCLFTNSPDEHFLIDLHPEHPQVVVASPCSGHGYKFASVVGEVVADLAQRGETKHDIALFRLSRFGR